MHEDGKQMQDQGLRDQPPPEGPGIWTGVALTLGLHLIQIPLALVSSGLTFFFIGLSQLVYIIPVMVWVAARRKESELAKGLAIGAGVTFLLNATCFGVVWLVFLDM